MRSKPISKRLVWLVVTLKHVELVLGEKKKDTRVPRRKETDKPLLRHLMRPIGDTACEEHC